MPAKTGIQNYLKTLDSRFRGNDAKGRFKTFYETIKVDKKTLWNFKKYLGIWHFIQPPAVVSDHSFRVKSEPSLSQDALLNIRGRTKKQGLTI